MAIFDMLGRHAAPAVDDQTASKHIDQIFHVRCVISSRMSFSFPLDCVCWRRRRRREIVVGQTPFYEMKQSEMM
jgi:hypothetical protein